MPLRSERRFISINNVTPGMMIQFNYTKKSGGSGSYTVLVVDPNRQNDHASEPQLHGFVIDELSDSQLIEFFASFGKTINLDYEDRRASVVEGLNTDEAYNMFKVSKYVDNRSYRTFNLSSMSSVRQILLGATE
jgi:hypothetical protein